MAHTDTLLLATRKGLIVIRKNNGAWHVARVAHPGTPVSYSTWDASTQTLWACLDHGHWGQKLSRSADWGETWQEVPAPKYPEGATTNTHHGAPQQPATLQYQWVLQPAGKLQPGTLYMGTVPGGLFVSNDNGDHFNLVESLWNLPTRSQWFGGGKDLPGIHSVIIDPRNAKHIHIGISCAGVLETTDGGASWQYANKGLRSNFLPEPDLEIGHDPHFVTHCPSHPDVLWQQNHCGIFRSANSGKQWQDISQPEGPANFGFVIAADERDANTAWVIPAKADSNRAAFNAALCVCRTEDGGKTWHTLREGLPQQNCFDVVYRHGLDRCGNTLAFGSTTGNAYLSSNRGESWQCLGNHFPPIYSVRFVTTE